MSAHLALPALTGDPTLPATLSRAVMHDLLRDELGFRGVTITDALDMGALPQGDAQVDRRDRGAPRRRRPAAVHGPDPWRRRGSRAGSATPRRAGCSTPASWRRRRGGSLALRRRLAPVAQPPSSTSSGRAEHEALARELAERSMTLVRDDAGLLPLRLARGCPGRRRSSPRARPDAGRHVVDGRARPRGRAPRRHPATSTSSSSTHAPTTRRSPRLARPRGRRRCSCSARSRLAPSRPRPALCEALLATGGPAVTVALRTPFDLAAYPASPTHVCTYGILAPSLEALAARPVRRAAVPRPPPRPDPGLYPTGHGLAADRAARSPMSLASRSASSPRSSRASSPGRRRSRPIAARPSASHARRSRRHRRPRDLGPRRDLRPVPVRRPASAAGRARDAVDRLALRRRAAVRPVARHRDQPVRRVAGHRRGGRRGPPPGRARRSRSPTSPASALAAAAEHVIDLGAGPELRGRRDEDVHGGARRDRAARGRAGRPSDAPGAFAGVPDAIEAALETEDAARDAAAAHAAWRTCIVVGRGLRVRDRARVGAQAQGARPGRRRPVLRRGLPARAAGAGRARLPGARDRAVGRGRRRPRRAAARAPRGLRRGPGRRVRPRGRPRPRPRSHRGPGRRPRPPDADRLDRARASCSPTTRRSPAASTPMRPATSAR